MFYPFIHKATTGNYITAFHTFRVAMLLALDPMDFFHLATNSLDIPRCFHLLYKLVCLFSNSKVLICQPWVNESYFSIE